MTPPHPADPFGTAALRRRVLDAWTASPARFREDANAEEDYALGGYRDRLVVELAQNAADAAVRSGSPGRLLLRLAPDPAAQAGLALVAANTGTPLDAEGVQALATLRASAKRDDEGPATVGRFGVGFAAVLDVTDEPALRSTTGGVRWSRAATADEVAAVAVLAAEAARRGGHVPVLRLPWPDAVPPPPSYDSAVVLPLRDAAAAERVRAALADVDEAILLMLPALAEVEVDDGSGGPSRVVRAADLAVRRVEASGPLDPGLLADRPAEERRTSRWSVVWALPRPGGTRAVLHAPTPTDEPVGLPAVLVASFPLDPSRRHVAPGPLRDFLVGRAAEAYAELARTLAQRGVAAEVDEVLALVPGPVAEGALDADLRQAVLALLPSVPLLPGGLRPDQAVAVDGLPAEAAQVLADVVPGLVPPAWAGRRELDRLGVRRTRLADLVDDLAALDRPPAWWARLHATLAGADREALSGLPVPLADGRLVRGPRGVVVGAGPDLAAALGALAVRVADPAVAASPEAVEVLLRLGAVPADAGGLLDEPVVRAAVEASVDADDPGPVADAVLRLVGESGRDAGDLPWLARLALPDDEGGWSEAGELVLAGSELDGLLVAGQLGHPDPGLVATSGADLLAAVGVLRGFALVRDDDVALDPDACDHDLDGEDGWLDDVLDRLAGAGGSTGDLPPTLPSYTAVRDLDLVAAERWPEALRLLAGEPGLRAAVVEPAAVLLADGRRVDVEPYTAWWLRTHPVLAGRRPDSLRSPGTAALAGLLDEAPDVGVDPGFLRALGVVTSVAEVATAPMVLPLLAAAVDPAGARPDGPGVRRPVPVAAAQVLGEVPPSYVEHDDLTVSGVACDWWVDDEGEVHAATLDGLARGLAWAAGQWERRLLLAAVLADPDRAGDLSAEASWDRS